MLTPKQVAKIANVHPNTIRNYSSDYAELLSPSARGEAGPRLYSDKDVETIRAIAALRNSGVPPGEIIERVRTDEAPPIIDVMPTPTQAPLQEATEALQTQQEAPLALHVAHNALQARVEAVERHLEAEIVRIVARIETEAERATQAQRERTATLVTGIVLGGAFVLVIVAVVLWLN